MGADGGLDKIEDMCKNAIKVVYIEGYNEGCKGEDVRFRVGKA